jgi:6-phosphofructokinase
MLHTPPHKAAANKYVGVAISMSTLWADTLAFNRINGQLQDLTKEGFKKQLGFIQSELKELADGLEANDKVEQLDGCIDVLVTTMGYMQRMAEAYGCDLAQAADLVGANNLSKFPSSMEVAMQSVPYYKAKGIPVEVRVNEAYNVWVVRNTDTGKVMKPVDYVSVDLSKCFPTLQ